MSIEKTNSMFEHLDLSLLRYFFNVASYGGFSKASRATGISQPSLSLGLQRLEKILAINLIERSSVKFSLTPAGIKLFSFCQKLEGNLDEVLTSLSQNLSTVRRRYRIGVAFSLGCAPLSSLCKSIHQSTESVDLELTSGGSFQLLDALNAGAIDAAIVSDDASDPRIRLIPLRTDRVTFVISRDRLKLFQAKTWKQAVSKIPLITYSRDTPMRSLVDKICFTEKLQFSGSISVNGVDALKSLIMRGAGCGFVLRSSVESELKDGSLLEAPGISISLPRRNLMLATRIGEEACEAAMQVRTLLNDN